VFGRDKRAVNQQRVSMDRWVRERAACAEHLQTAMTFQGTTAPELMLAADEAVFYKVTRCSLIGNWIGLSLAFCLWAFGVRLFA
jgi:hypothetical protein